MHEVFDEQRNVPFFGSERDLDDLTVLVQNCLRVLREATSLREMVLETWLTVDYAVRMFLLSGFELSRFWDQDFDLQYKLLPRDFGGLIGLLEYVVRFNAALPLDPEPAKADKVAGFRASEEFWRFVRDRFPELIERIKEVERQYRVATNTELIFGEDHLNLSALLGAPDRIDRMRPEWQRVARALGSDWFTCAKQLNKARNLATHSHRTEEIAKALGVSGPNAAALTKKNCFQLLQVLLGISDEALGEGAGSSSTPAENARQ